MDPHPHKNLTEDFLNFSNFNSYAVASHCTFSLLFLLFANLSERWTLGWYKVTRSDKKPNFSFLDFSATIGNSEKLEELFMSSLFSLQFDCIYLFMIHYYNNFVQYLEKLHKKNKHSCFFHLVIFAIRILVCFIHFLRHNKITNIY